MEQQNNLKQIEEPAQYDNFVFYGSWRATLEGFKEDFGEDYAKEALWNLMLMATAGDLETNKKSIIGFVQGCCMPNIKKAQDRYEQAVINGAKGGAPKLIFTAQQIMDAYKEGKSWDAAAAILHTNVRTLRERRKELGIDKNGKMEMEDWKNGKNSQNLIEENNFEITSEMEKWKNGKKVDIDIENDIDIDNDIEKDIETDLSQMKVDPESDTTPTPGFEKYSPDEIRNFRRLGFVI